MKIDHYQSENHIGAIIKDLRRNYGEDTSPKYYYCVLRKEEDPYIIDLSSERYHDDQLAAEALRERMKELDAGAKGNKEEDDDDGVDKEDER